MLTNSIRRFVGPDGARVTFLEVRSTIFKTAEESLRVIEISETVEGDISVRAMNAGEGALAINRILSDWNWKYEEAI